MKFFLGTHMPHWLATVDFPLFVSHRRLAGRKRLPAARTEWALDSGGFTELSMHGRWHTNPSDYITAVRRYRDEIGNLAWAAPQDWMCEPWITAKTGLRVADHQARTVRSYLDLREAAPDLPFIPVLQGWQHEDYLRCVDLYDRAGVDLTGQPIVGVGTMCRRQATPEIARLVAALADAGIRMHGFGVKSGGLAQYAADLASADSLAWSSRGRRVAGCTPTHKSEANCLAFAAAWRSRLLHSIRFEQPALFGGAA